MVGKASLDILDGPPSQIRRERCGTGPGQWSVNEVLSVTRQTQSMD